MYSSASIRQWKVLRNSLYIHRALQAQHVHVLHPSIHPSTHPPIGLSTAYHPSICPPAYRSSVCPPTYLPIAQNADGRVHTSLHTTRRPRQPYTSTTQGADGRVQIALYTPLAGRGRQESADGGLRRDVRAAAAALRHHGGALHSALHCALHGA